MATLSSSKWKERQARDPFVRRAQAEGWRSRAVFKLQELQERDKLARRGDLVLDLGSAPGAWSQYLADLVGESGHIVAVDLLAMPALERVTFIQGDFSDDATLAAIRAELNGRKVNLVLSDMAPNMSGNRGVDQPRAMYLCELTLDLAGEVLRPGGHLLVKLFQGEGFQEFVAACRARFEQVKLRKPAASRQGNREIYLVARNFRL
jgi:23S rRNA (uridine2552-2'-O)-methyltransferase